MSPNRDPPPIALLSELATALCESGTPAHRLEEALGRVAEILQVNAQFFAMPTAVFASFDVAEGNITRLLRNHAGDTNLSRLVDLGRVLDDLIQRRVSIEEARERIAAIRSWPPPYGRVLTVACFCLVAACAARFFGGGAREVLIAPVAGLAVGALAVFSNARFARITEFLAGILAACIAVAAGNRLGPLAPRVVMLAGLIVLIPGLSLTLAVTELATRNLVAGTSRLMGALTTFVGIGFGVAIGQKAAQTLMSRSIIVGDAGSAAGSPLPEWTLPLSLAIVPLPLGVLFLAKPRDAWAIAASAFIAFYGARLGAWWLGPELGVCIAAMLVGVASNLYSRLTGHPAAVPLLPGILLLVPGSMGFESIHSFVARDTLAGVATAFDMLFVAVAIVAGLLMANVSMPSKSPL